ncbi:MAG: hypothetical protein ABW075_02550 [Aeromicrobium sp.]
MRRLVWFAGLAMLPAACTNETVDAPMPTYTGTVAVDEAEIETALFVEGTLQRYRGCLVVALDQDEDGQVVRAMLRLPADSGAELGWRDDRLLFHDRSYSLGSRLVFRATLSSAADLPDVPQVCRDAGVETAASAVPTAQDLSLDPSAKVIGTGDQLRVPVAELSNAGMDAAMGSDLAVVGERCLGVERPGVDTLLIWPFGTTVSYDPDPVVLLPDGTTYAVGDRLELGGGYIEESDTSAATPPVPVDGLPAECQELDRFLVSPF